VPAFAAGTIVAMIVGYFTLALLMRILKTKGFHNFAYYCFGIGAVTLILGAMGY
jgi:undecaprenyl-diphosphatase